MKVNPVFLTRPKSTVFLISPSFPLPNIHFLDISADLCNWNIDKVRAWISNIISEETGEAFYSHNVDGNTLGDMPDDLVGTLLSKKKLTLLQWDNIKEV